MRIFAGWYDNYTITDSFDFSTVSNTIIPKDYYIFKLKTIETFSSDETDEGSSIIRFMAAYRKVSFDKAIPITTVSGWRLLGTGDDNLFTDFFGEIFDLTKVSTIWTWNETNWEIWSPDENIMNLLQQYGVKSFSVIYRNRGFWVNFK